MLGLLHQLISWSVRQRYMVLFGTFLFACAGIFALKQMKFDAFPDLTNVQVQVVTASPGMDSKTVESLVTTPLERALGGVPNMEVVRSISRAGVSSITIVFKEGTDLWHARQLIKERVDSVRDQIPDDAGQPELAPPSTGLGEVYQFVVRSPEHSTPELYRIFEQHIAPRLRTVDGVVEVNAWGGGRPQLDVLLNLDAMAARRVTVAQVQMALEESVTRLSGGVQFNGAEQLSVRGRFNPNTPSDIERILIPNTMPPMMLKDVAVVRQAGALTVGLGSSDGQGESIFVMVQLLAGADALKTVEQLKLKMPNVQKSLPKGVEMEVIYSRDKLVKNTLSTIQYSLLEGGLLVIFVLLLLLGDLRAGLIVATVIPLSLLGAFIGLSFFGYSGNLMSLGAIDFGLVVDGSIVIVESIVAMHLSQHEDLKDAIVLRAQQVAKPVLFAMGILLLVYIPILTLSGTEGKLFRPMALTVLFALMTSLVLAFTYVPACAALWVKPKAEHQTFLMRWIDRGYHTILYWLMPRRWLMVMMVILALGISAFFGSRLGIEFVPKLEEGDVVIQTSKLPSLGPDEALRSSSKVESILLQFPEVLAVGSRTGSPAVATDPMGMEEADILVKLAPRDSWKTAKNTNDLVQSFSEALTAEMPGTEFNFTQPIEMRFNELLEGIPSDVGVKIYGPDTQVLSQLAEQVAQQLKLVPGSADVQSPAAEGVPSVEYVPIPDALMASGLHPYDVLQLIELEQKGRPVAFIEHQGFQDPIVLKLSAETRSLPIDQRVIVSPTGQVLPLGSLIHANRVETPARIDHEAGSRKSLVQANVRGRDLGVFIKEAQARVDALKLPPGYWIEWGGKYEQLKAATIQMSIVIPLVLIAVILLLILAFRQWQHVVLILLNVPIAISGGIVILWVRQMPLSISAVIGCITLFGIAVMNGIVMLSRMQELHQHVSSQKAASQAALERLRPVLTTALVAGLGFVPMALATGVGAEVQRPLATVVIGGLLSSTILTLFALPVFYTMMFKEHPPSNGDA